MNDPLESNPDDQFDPRARELCPDDNCIGLIGPDGFCRECGKPGLGAGPDPRTRGLRSTAEIALVLEADIVAGDLPEAPDGFEDRRLCPDGTCIGLIRDDGRCSECGRASDPARA
ncbi:hypothetical protein [Haliangium sp.]|uniref:hypothetical protein n=1 Tax=Haliangium sp. TaxID=2663208 RepID=UPI003D0C39E7